MHTNVYNILTNRFRALIRAVGYIACGIVVFPLNLTFVTVFYERFRKVCPQYNTLVHAMECNKSMHLRKVCPQCNTTVHVKRSVCDCGHAFALKKRESTVYCCKGA